jgi:hypothetical protein
MERARTELLSGADEGSAMDVTDRSRKLDRERAKLSMKKGGPELRGEARAVWRQLLEAAQTGWPWAFWTLAQAALTRVTTAAGSGM